MNMILTGCLASLLAGLATGVGGCSFFLQEKYPTGFSMPRSDLPLKELFYPPSPGEVIKILAGVGLEFQEAWQTLFQPPSDIKHEEEPKRGFGQGGFVVLKAIRKL